MFFTIFLWLNEKNKYISFDSKFNSGLLYKGTEFLPQTIIFIISTTKCRRPFIFQTMTYIISTVLNFKYSRFTPLAWKGIGIKKSEFVTKTQFILSKFYISSKTIEHLVIRIIFNQSTLELNTFNT